MESQNQSQDKDRAANQPSRGDAQANARKTTDEGKKTEKPQGDKKADSDRRGAGR